MTVGGHTYSLLQGGSSVVVDGSTEAVSQVEKSFATVYTIGSQTLVAGGSAITVSGSVVSLGSDGQSIVISGSVTEDVTSWLGSSRASGKPKNSGSTSVSASKTSASHKNLSSRRYERVEGRAWTLWLAVLLSILRFGEVL
jgi:hypothetical protein